VIRPRRVARYALWTLVPYLGRTWSLGVPDRVTLLLTYCHPRRTRHLAHQVRNLLRCDFVERIVVSSHNPDLRLDSLLTAADDRVMFRQEPVRRGCGHRWRVARTLDAAYVIAVDDDLLLFPWQLAKLYAHLLEDPEVPHGFAGMLRLEDGGLEYHERENRPVDYLSEVYALTRKHLERYEEIERRVKTRPGVGDMIEQAADFVLIGHAGRGRPRIHRVGRLLRCETFNQAGLALHKEAGFAEQVRQVGQALKDLASLP
jgi:hypothetical protein